MIQIFAPCYIPYVHGTMIHGSTANTVLPDPLLGSLDFQGTKVLLNKTIGDDFYWDMSPETHAPRTRMYKAYDLLGDILYEYSLFQIDIPGSADPYFIPISVKRYDSKMPYTFLFTRGVTLALDTLRGTRDYSVISATALAKSFNGSAISFVDTMFSIELPSMMENILAELGTYAYHDPASADLVLRNIFEELSRSYDSLIAYDCPKDIISYYGCKEDNILPMSVIKHSLEPSTNGFYGQYAYEVMTRLTEKVGRITPLDIKQLVFHNLHVSNILNELYQAPYTDINMEVDHGGAKNVHVQKLFGIQTIEPESAWSRLTTDASVATYLHDGLIYHNQHHRPMISKISFMKDWLDNVVLDVYHDDGTYYSYYLSMALYHLYSQSIVRIHRTFI